MTENYEQYPEGERLLYEDEDGEELVYDKLLEAAYMMSRPVKAGELTGYIARGHPRYEFEESAHLRRVNTLLERLVRKGRVAKEKRRGFTYYSPILGS